MTNSEKISELVDKYLYLIKNDHHKSKDGYFWIETFWAGYDRDETIPMYQAMHQGYLNELHGEKRFKLESAEQDMIKFLEEIIADYRPEDDGMAGDWEYNG